MEELYTVKLVVNGAWAQDRIQKLHSVGAGPSSTGKYMYIHLY
jgi:hypothetical protein